jgi:hypothetical protein
MVSRSSRCEWLSAASLGNDEGSDEGSECDTRNSAHCGRLFVCRQRSGKRVRA